ncbi:MAG TPA: saccharopine dehydrogenase NADP-binding domain-containing protein [Thermoanaerobaculia bacterium]|nr:saccharopine dehydrogenase NADP-binding domain-containing protein [Thermoanaerobaculia bacterium]
MTAAQWMIYGANGYTGELIAREAVKRGQRPILAGRNAERAEALARQLGCEARVFDLDSPDLSGVALVLHCAGPFIHTSKPMVKACLAAGVHYLDITGEIAVFETIMRRDAEARERGVVLLPGVGFDVVPTDCLGAMLHAQLPDANELWLAFSMRGGSVSRGTAKTMLEGAGIGGAIRRNGKIEVVPHLYDVRTIPFASGPRLAVTIPWGDVSTAFHTTGIPNIRTYSSQSPRAVRRLRWMRRLLPLLRIGAVRRFAQKMAEKTPGPSAEQRASGRIDLWGRVANASGTEITKTMSVAEGYQFTVLSSLAAVERVLAAPRGGAFTPAKYFGAQFVTEIPGTEV